ncbi:hypothetical protein BHE74_00054176 [Ensete ventricosum]|nr:hypothetical protein BHE74_00054176 [Ensete ventricosum]
MRTMQLGTCLECVGNLLGWRKGVCWKKTKTRGKIVRGSRKACRDLGRKLAGNMSGDHRKKTRRLVVRMSELPDWWECFRRLTRSGLRLNCSYLNFTGFGLHPKKISNERRCASRRTWEWT